MRLINAKTLQLEVFNDTSSPPPYAILSHRWVDGEEVTFDDMRLKHRHWIPGWSKIQPCCQKALADDLLYTWVDTCCIDKSSSTELSEAINSMYIWYFNAVRCYAYLNDVNKASNDLSTLSEQTLCDIVRSKWFTRAWTLQELIAPRFVVFYDANFQELASKADIAHRIEASAKIPKEVLTNPQKSKTYPVGVRMSRAANRDASRVEDVAYSLFGLFEVDMPLLYGEGTRAFRRLQEEIIRHSYDQSIFAWSPRDRRLPGKPDFLRQLPLLALSPGDFENFQDVTSLEDDDEKRPYGMMNGGIQIELQIFPYDLDTYVALLACGSSAQGRKDHRYGILLRKESDRASRWHRVQLEGRDTILINRAGRLETFAWKNMHIIKSPLSTYAESGPGELAGAWNHPRATFYGLEINAPEFLKYNDNGARPYALIAYHDWEFPGGTVKMQTESEQLQSHLFPHHNERRPSLPHTNLMLPRDQTQILNDSPKAIFVGDRDAPTLTIIEEDSGNQQITSTDVLRGFTDYKRRQMAAKPIGVFEMPLMTTGTAGAVFFDRSQHGIRSIKVGFDFDFYPVLFLATDEAEIDPQIERWMRKGRYALLDRFERTHYLLDDFHAQVAGQFWKLQPDILRTQEPQEIYDDESIKVHKGVYAFTAKDKAEPKHWIFKPYQNQDWHIVLALERGKREGRTCWQFTVTKRDDPLEVNVMLEGAGKKRAAERVALTVKFAKKPKS